VRGSDLEPTPGRVRRSNDLVTHSARVSSSSLPFAAGPRRPRLGRPYRVPGIRNGLETRRIAAHVVAPAGRWGAQGL